MYGFTDKAMAEAKAIELRKRNPQHLFEVGPHSFNQFKEPVTWGVKRFVPYCEAVPYRFDGFVWFDVTYLR